jgi:tRNA G18 (ribose-2'-O)-methylase SpoU
MFYFSVFYENEIIMRKLLNEELNRLTVEEFKKTDKIPIIVILDNIRSMNNIGSVFRSSDAFCVEKIYLCGITAVPPHNDIHKTALGATESVDWEYVENTLEVVEKVKEEGFKIVSIEQAENSIKLNNTPFNSKDKLAVILGHEVRGVQQSVINASDYVLEIPQFGTKHSLNISVCAGVVLWEIAKKFLF